MVHPMVNGGDPSHRIPAGLRRARHERTNMTRHTLSVLVDNEAGVLSQVSRLFSRKGYNIESLAVGTTDDPAVSRITIEVLADDGHASS